MPAPHTHLIAAFTGKELPVGYIQLFTAKGANIILLGFNAEKKLCRV
jgi:hypothetical protein